MAVIDELLVGLGFDYDDKDIKKFKKDIDDTGKVIKALVKVTAAAATAIIAMTVASTRASDELGKMAAEVGETVENIDALQFALQRSGGTAEGLSSGLRRLSMRAGEAARGVGRGAEAFGLLGISVTDANGQLRPTGELLLEVSKQMQGLERGQQLELANKLGLRDTIRLLQQGPEAIQELIKEAQRLGVTTAEDAAIAAEFQDGLTDLWQVMKQISRSISRIFAPLLTRIVKTFTDWWAINREILNQKLQVFIEGLGKALRVAALSAAAFTAVKVLAGLLAFKRAIQGITIATLAMNAAISFLPVLIGAAFLLLGALLDDIIIFFRGGDSAIGDLIEKFPILGEIAKVVAVPFQFLWSIISKIIDGVMLLGKLFTKPKGDLLTGDNKPLNPVGAPVGLSDFVSERFENFSLGAGARLIADRSENFSLGAGASLRADRETNFNRGGSGGGSITNVDKIEIMVDGGRDSATEIAQAVNREFQQATKDLNTAVEQ